MQEIEITLEQETSNEFVLEIENEPIKIIYNMDLQEKTVSPAKEIQEIVPDEEYDGLSKVTVEPIPEEYVIPKLDTKTITENGIYNASDDNLDGYSSVEVATSGVDINDYFNDAVAGTGSSQGVGIARALKKIPDDIQITGTNGAYMFHYCDSLETIPLLDTSNITSMSNMFYYCSSLKEIPSLNTSNVVNMYSTFYSCRRLTKIPELDGSKITSLSSNTFTSCNALTDFGGLKNLGKAYSTTTAENYSSYTLSLNHCNNLTHDSLMNVINNLYDIKTAGCKNQKLILGSTNLAKLTEEEIAIATNKGWNVS